MMSEEMVLLWLAGIVVFTLLFVVVYGSTLPSKNDRMKEILDQYPECADEIESVIENKIVYIKGAGYDSPTYFLVCESKQIKLEYYPNVIRIF